MASSSQIKRDVDEIMARAALRAKGKVTYGKFLVYATPADLEGEVATLAGARRMAAKLRKLGYRPIIKRHASAGGWSWNEVIEDEHRNARVRR
jgi:hypothetical protein